MRYPVRPRLATKFCAALALFALLPCSARAQDTSQVFHSTTRFSLSRGNWDFGPFIGGGVGLFGSSYEKFAMTGFHVGRVMSKEHLPSFLRGNFELAGDFMPVFEFIQSGQPIYGGAFFPAIPRWDFKGNGRVIPYVQFAGGGIATTSNVPPGNSSTFNFSAGGSVGFHFLLRPRRALTIETRWLHISNANLGTKNPQLVANFFLSIGYTWFR